MLAGAQPRDLGRIAMSESNTDPSETGSEKEPSQSKEDSKMGMMIGLVMFGAILVLMIVAQLLRT
jgi:hypothetical protein